MRWVIEIITFTITLAIILFWASNTFLPIFYSLPRIIYRVIKKTVQPKAILLCLIAPISWNIGLLILALIIVVYLPKLHAYLIGSAGFSIGQVFGLVIFAFSAFNKDSRGDMRADFEDFIKPYRISD